MRTELEKQMLAALEEINLRLCQTRIANGIGRKAVKKRESFLLGEMDRIESFTCKAIIDANSREEPETRPQGNGGHQELRTALQAILAAFDDGELRDLNDAIENSRAVLTNTKPKLFHVWNETDGVTVTGAMPERDARRFIGRYMDTWRELDYYLDYSGNRRPLEELKLTLRPVP